MYNAKICMSTASARHPQTDGQTENLNSVLVNSLRYFVELSQTDWDTLISVAEFVTNNAWTQSIQNTPFVLNDGLNPDFPMLAFLQIRNPAVNKLVGRGSEKLQCAQKVLQAPP